MKGIPLSPFLLKSAEPLFISAAYSSYLNSLEGSILWGLIILLSLLSYQIKKRKQVILSETPKGSGICRSSSPPRNSTCFRHLTEGGRRGGGGGGRCLGLCGDEAKVSCAQRAADVHMKCAESTTSCPFVSSVLVKLPSGGEKRKSRKWAVVFSAYFNIFHSCLLEFSVYRLHLTKKTFSIHR